MSLLAALAVPFAAVAPATAADWRSDLAIYMWGAGLNGTTGVGQVDADVDLSFSDVLSDLEFGAMAGYAVTNGRWVVLADAVIANVGATKDGKLGVLRADVDVDLTLLEADLGYTVGTGFQLFAGARYVDVTTDLDLGVANQRVVAKAGDSWVDPVVGFRVARAAGDRWGFWLRGDVGGFGVGSDLSWNAVAAFSYRVNDRFSLGAGYRLLDIDYEDGTGRDRFLYDLRMDGPVAGAIFSF